MIIIFFITSNLITKKYKFANKTLASIDAKKQVQLIINILDFIQIFYIVRVVNIFYNSINVILSEPQNHSSNDSFILN